MSADSSSTPVAVPRPQANVPSFTRDGAGSAAAADPVARRHLPLLIALFVGSGCAALIYEIVWFQLLSLNLGSSAISMGVLLGTFMGGMCIGSLLLPRYLSPREHPLQAYAKIEFAIAALGLFVLFAYPLIGGLYTKIGGPGMFGIFVRAIIAAICLLPPTILMGATLPAIARWVESSPKGVAWLGFFYGGNIAGAVLGSLLAGFYLLRVHDVMVATFAAVAINVTIGFIALSLARSTSYTPTVQDTGEKTIIPPGSWPVYIAIGLSGLTALGSEVIWTRLLSLTLGGTTYTFSLILAGFLLGLGIGSSAGAALARSIQNPRTALGLCQMMVMAGIAWAAYSLTTALPEWPINPGYATSSLALFQIDMVRCLWTVIPGAVFWGASFPLALASIASDRQDPGKLVGTVYAANTVGAILGAVFSSLIAITWIGTKGAQQLMIVIAALSAILALSFIVRREDGTLVANARNGGLVLATAVLAIVFAVSVKKVPDLLIAYGRYAITYKNVHGEFVVSQEGMNSSMVVSRNADGALNYHNAGKVQASSLPQDMSLQRMLGHLTHLLVQDPESVLVIGCGAGVTAGAVAIGPEVDRVIIAEIEPKVPEFVARYFAEHNYDVIARPNVTVKTDDGRHFLLTHKGKFNGITSDPFDPWVKGAATLYTEEFWREARSKLKPGGAVTVFVQLYEAGMAAVKSEIATFLKVFPQGIVFGNTFGGRGYDIVLVGFPEDDRKIDVDFVQRRLDSPQYAEVAQSLREIGVYSAVDLFAKFAAQGKMLDTWLADAQINKDRNLRLQYLAGLGVNAYEQEVIYSQILSHRQFPENLFTGDQQTIDMLRTRMMSMQ